MAQIYKNPLDLADSLNFRPTDRDFKQRELNIKYGDFLKAHPENIKWSEPNEYGDQNLEWDDGRAFLDSIGYKGDKDQWHKENPDLGLYAAFVEGYHRNDPESADWRESLKNINPEWYWRLGFDDGPLGTGRYDDADPAVQKLKDAGWSDERIAAAEKGIKEKHPETLFGSKSRFAQKYPDRFAKLQKYNVYGKGRTAEDVDWDFIAKALGVDLD